MAVLVWDDPGVRFYENGVDHGVLYIPDGPVVPWNGLTSVVERSGKVASSVYYDGIKVSQPVLVGEFQATMKAITYPDEFLDCEGIVEVREGVLLNDQPLKPFSLSYRSRIRNDTDADGYKIHIIYNAIATPKDKAYETNSETPDAMEFEWDIVSIPEEIPGYRPTSHITIDTLDLDPDLLIIVEELLYGSSEVDPELPTLPALVELLEGWAILSVMSFGDGTWSATTPLDDIITVEDDVFTIDVPTADYIDAESYNISDYVDSTGGD